MMGIVEMEETQIKICGEAISKNIVIIKRLRADHGQETFTRYLPLDPEMVKEVDRNVKEIFDGLGGSSLIKSSGEVYIKPNGVGPQPYVFTRPEVLEAAIRYWFNAGASQVYLLENSSQAALTRLVFEQTGYAKVCKRTGAKPVYLDEDKTVPYPFAGKGPVSEGDPKGYDLTTFGMPRTVAEKLIEGRDRNLYVSIPKLKTHLMAVVTLGIKNQWGLVPHDDRIADHNYNLHSKLVDVLSLVQPDVTLIEGVEGTIYGHYPPLALADRCVRPFKILIGGLNVVATDIVGARVLGMEIDDVPHIKIAIERGLGAGVQKQQDIRISGDFDDIRKVDVLSELAKFGGKYPNSLYPAFPNDVVVITGKEMACMEGCLTNSLSGIQLMSLDYGGKGGWTLVVGKGFDNEDIERLTGPVLVDGKCAVKEVGQRLVERLGRRKVYLTTGCNNITARTEALCHLMQVEPIRMGGGISPIKAIAIIARAKLNGSHARQISAFSRVFKRR
jgi:uncharacterized protein (DUF362 family)